MPVQSQIGEDGTVTVAVTGLAGGLDSQSEPTGINPRCSPDVQNMTTNGGYPSGMDGATLHIAGFVAPDGNDPLVLARYTPSTGTAAYLMACQNGIAYRSTDGGATWTILRRGLSTTEWWSHTQLGDYLVIGNGTNTQYKYDGTRLIPLGAKHIADMEAGEAVWAGGAAEATGTYIKQGVQSRKLTALAGATASMTLTPATAWDLTTGLLAARDYADTDAIAFWVYIDSVANLTAASSYIRFGDAADANYYQLVASSWGTLGDGFNLVQVLKSAFAVGAGAPNWNNIAKLTFLIDAAVGVDVNCWFDDCYMIYATVMPPCQILTSWKNMLLGHTGSDQYFSPAGAPDEFDTVDTSVNSIDANDGTEITGAHPYADYMLATKDNSVHAVSVQFRNLLYPDYDFSVQRVTTEHGSSSHRGMLESAGRVYMWWRDSIHGFAGIGTQKASEIVTPTLGDVEPTRLGSIVAGRLHGENQLYWFWTPNGGTENTSGIAINTTQQAWLPIVGQSVALAETVYEGDVEYLLTAGYTGRVSHQNDGATWDGTAITRHFALPWVSAGPPHPVVTWRRVKLNYETQVAGTLIVEYRTARHPREFTTATYATAASINMAAAAEYGWIKLAGRAPWFQVRFRTVGAQMALYWPITIEGTVQPGRRY